MAALIIPAILRGVQCDRCSATKDIDPELGLMEWSVVEAIRKSLLIGWTVWMGRSQRHYCPDCKPGPRTKMRRVA